LRLPITVGIMLLTVLSSLTLVLLSQWFPGIHTWAVVMVGRLRFEDLILHGLLGLLLFAGSFLLELEPLYQEKLSVGLLSVFGTVFSTAGVAVLMHTALPLADMPVPWLDCLFFGALISPTDPIAVLEMLHRVGMPKRIQAQLAGESLFNDGIGAVLFLAILDISHGGAQTTGHIGHVAWRLLAKACGGLLLGTLLARVASQLMKLVESYQIEILVTISLALGGYSLAETCGVSAPLEAVAAGLALRHFNMSHSHLDISHDSLDRFWRVVDEVQNAILFVLLGLEVLVIAFSRRTLLSGAIAIAGSTLIRAAVVALILLVVSRVQRKDSTPYATIILGGLRGGLSIALALSVPEENGRAWILATTYIVVVFSIVIQGGMLDLFLKRFGRQRKAAAES
jgi:CPA1 family monovalent cation:H+ antiporter